MVKFAGKIGALDDERSFLAANSLYLLSVATHFYLGNEIPWLPFRQRETRSRSLSTRFPFSFRFSSFQAQRER